MNNGINKDRDILLSEFENLLRGEAVFYVSLIELARQEQKVLVKNNIKDLESITHAIENMTVDLRKSANAGIVYLDKLKHYFSSGTEELTLSSLIAVIDEPFRSRFKGLQKELAAHMKEVHYLNECNASLVRHSLEYTNYLLSLFTGTSERSKVYTAAGTLNKCESTKLLDRHA